MTGSVNVEYQELLARAAELEAPLPTPPPDNPQAPCAISFIIDSGTQLAFSANAIRQSVAYCEQEYQALAQSLRNAAKAYEDVDQQAAAGVTDNSSISAASPRSARGNTQAMVSSDQEPPPPLGYDGYYELRQAAEDIEAPDQGPAYTKFENDWYAYSLELQEDVIPRLRPFEYWEGASATAVEANFEQQKKYIVSLAQYCIQISAQARGVVSAHKWAVTEHPSTYTVYVVDTWYADAVRRGDIVYQADCLGLYAEWQQVSEEVLAEYYLRAGVPLALVYPSTPPAAVAISAPSDTPAQDSGSDSGTGGSWAALAQAGTLSSKFKDLNVAETASNLDSLFSSETPVDTYEDAVQTPTVAPMGVPGLPTGLGIRPASLGGGGAPSMQPPLEAESAARGGAAGPAGAGGANRGPGGAAGGRGGMGAMPMAPGAGQGQGQGGKQAKRVGDEEDLYTEKRQWTSGVLGGRRRNDPADDGSK